MRVVAICISWGGTFAYNASLWYYNFMTELFLDACANPAETTSTNELVPNFRELCLCSLGETRLVEAFTDEAFVVVNGLMLVKGAGETVGIPLRKETSSGGRIEPTAWYEIDYGALEWDKRSAIRASFIQGETHINLPGVTKWFKLRDVKVDEVCPGEDLTQKAQEAAERLRPGTPMPAGISRRDYLNRHLEFPEI
jgi:hypothetical protein